jgi:serine/threonine protein phosphatase PrpC
MHGATTRSSNDNIQVGTCTIAGTDSDRPQKVNQDAFFSTSFVINTTSASHQKDYYVCAGVMDGHGLKGHVVTDFLAKQLPLCIQKQLHQPQRLLEWEEKVADLGNYYCQLQQQQQQQEENHDDVQHHHQILINAFHQAHVQAMENPEVPAGRSGATCIACLVDKDDIRVAYVGDSRAIRIFLTGPLSRPETTIAASPMVQVLAAETTVQKMPTERARIEACIQKQQQQEQGGGGGIRIDANGNIWYGPAAIAMTRALGDAVMLRAGVIPTPIVETFSRRSSKSDVSTTLRSAAPSSLIIMATDGIWDVLNNDQVAEIAQSTFALTNSVDELASILSQTARQRWKGDIDMPLMDEKSDDITCVCIHC